MENKRDELADKLDKYATMAYMLTEGFTCSTTTRDEIVNVLSDAAEELRKPEPINLHDLGGDFDTTDGKSGLALHILKTLQNLGVIEIYMTSPENLGKHKLYHYRWMVRKFEEMPRGEKPKIGIRCAVCDTSLWPGMKRCPKCKTPIDWEGIT